jgi:hypothetical protein
MPSGDIMFDQGKQIFKDFKEKAKDWWEETSENDKHTLHAILNQMTETVKEGVIHGDKYMDMEIPIVKASMVNLSAKIKEKAINALMEFIGERASVVGKAFLSGMVGL